MELMPHQIADADFLAARKFAGCFNGMGTGKTLTALEAFLRATADRLIIVGPPISLPMWKREAERHTGLDAQILKSGTTKIGSVRILVMSYDIARRRVDELMDWAMQDGGCALICDESHALKSTVAKRTKAILGRGGLCTVMRHSWMLTGTPITRWSDDLIPFLFRAAPGDVRQNVGALSVDRFRLRYCITKQKQYPGAWKPVTVVVGDRNLDELGSMLSTCATRRTLDEVWEAMPPLTFTRLPVEPRATPELREAKKAIAERSAEKLAQGLRSAEEPLAPILRVLGLSLVPEAAEFVYERIDSGAGPVLIGGWHKDVLGLMTSTLRAKKLRVEQLDGETPAAKKSELERMFNDGELDALVGQIGAMGVSLNLQRGGNNIVVIEEAWSPSVMDQFYARLHRMGQERPVHVDTLYIPTKLADAIHAVSQNKRRSHATVAAAHQEGDHTNV